MRLVLVVCGLAGCAQIAGIDETTGPARPDPLSVTVEQIQVGASVVRGPIDLGAITGLTAQYQVPDESEADGLHRVDAKLTTTDTWSADVPTGTPPVVFDLPDYPTPVKRQVDLAQRNIFVLYGRMQHPDPEPAPAGATLSVQSTLPSPIVAGEAFQLYTLGSWNVRSFSAAETPIAGAATFGPVTFPFSSMGSITGRPLEKLTTADAVLLLRYVGNKLTGVMAAAPFDQTGTDSITGAMTAVIADQTLGINVGPPAQVLARYAPVRPSMPTVSMAWFLHAAPGYEIGNDNGPLLDAAGVAMADTGMISTTYGNPFVAKRWPTVLTWATSASRTYAPAGQLPVALTAGLFQQLEPTAGATLDLPAGLPEVITIDGRPLSSDGLAIPRSTQPVHIAFVSGITNNTLYQLQIYELVPNAANTALVQKIALSATALAPQFTLAADVLAPGKLYNLRAICLQGGYPGATVGDLRPRSLPTAVGYLDGGVFKVTP